MVEESRCVLKLAAQAGNLRELISSFKRSMARQQLQSAALPWQPRRRWARGSSASPSRQPAAKAAAQPPDAKAQGNAAFAQNSLEGILRRVNLSDSFQQ